MGCSRIWATPRATRPAAAYTPTTIPNAAVRALGGTRATLLIDRSVAMKVGIVGAGIGGLVAAVAFARIGASVTVYERSPAVGPVGAGISLFGNGFRALGAV